jgi:hypothetical protein
MKKFKTAKDFLKTCSKDEQDYVYESYWKMLNYDMIDMIYKHFPASVFIKQVEKYRKANKKLKHFPTSVLIKQVEQYKKANKKSNKIVRMCDCDFVGCRGC